MDTSRKDILSASSLQPHRHDHVLWALVAFSTLHMVEEYAFDWPAWLHSIGISCSETDMFVMNMSFFAIGVCAAVVGWKSPSFSLSYPALVLINTVFHIGASVIYQKLNPGTLTAVALFLPLGIRCFTFAWRDGVLTRRRLVEAFAIGLFIHAFPVFVILMRRSLSY